MAIPRVLITHYCLHPDDEFDGRLRAAGLEPVFNYWHGGRTEKEMIAILQGVAGAITSIDPFTPTVFEGISNLKVVARVGVGYDSVDVPAATAHGVAVCTSEGSNHVTVAEYAFALMISCARRLPEHMAEVAKGGWTRHPGTDLRGRTLGIIGLGKIGKELATRARAFGMKVLATDVMRDGVFAAQHQVEYVPLEELLRESDFVSLHMSLSESTRRIINAERMALMKPSAYLINTSRGGIVDQEALYELLKRKGIAGAALDVFENEPLEADSPLRTLDNVWFSPHASGMSVQAIQAMVDMATENVIRVLDGRKPLHAVNPEVLA